MSVHQEDRSLLSDKLKVIASVALLVGGVGGYYWSLSVLNVYVALAIFLIFVAAAIGLLVTSVPGKQFFLFFKEARSELRRVVWPTKSETWSMTYIVLIVILIFMLGLAAIDFVLNMLIQWFLSVR